MIIAGCQDEAAVTEPVLTPLPSRTEWIVHNISVVPSRWEVPGTYPLDFLSKPGWRQDPALAEWRKVASDPAEGNSPGVFDPRTLDPVSRKAIDAGLIELFGTVGSPRIRDISPDVEAELGLDPATLSAGLRLYQQHCALCHGVAGDGRGPAGAGYNPHPRDYSKGKFKYVSTQSKLAGGTLDKAGVAHRNDLSAVLIQGIDSAGMPSFSGLDGTQRQQLVSAVIYLSLRGFVEADTIKNVLLEELSQPAEIVAAQRLKLLGKAGLEGQPPVLGEIDHWRAAQNSRFEIPADPYSTHEAQVNAAVAGSVAFKQLCATCHIDYGRSPKLTFDQWGTIVQPRNLIEGRLRGGREDRDVALRILGGVDPSNMPTHAKEFMPTEVEKPWTDADKKAGAERLWQIVHFVQFLGNKSRRQELANAIRQKFPTQSTTFVD